MFIHYNNLEKGVRIFYKNQPYEIVAVSTMFKGRGQSALQVKLKNLINGSVISTTFHQSDKFEEIEVEKIKLQYLYSHQDNFVFCKEDNRSHRFQINDKQFSSAAIVSIKNFLRPNDIATGIFIKEKLVNISPDIKVVLKVVESMPKIKGEKADAGTKVVTLETGLKLKVPLFINQNDFVEVNTEENRYVRKVDLK
jgi:elongation factor P